MRLTTQELRELAEVERRMDAGEIDHVVYEGDRLAVSADAMKHFGFKTGQTISSTLFRNLLEYNLDSCQREIEARKNVH